MRRLLLSAAWICFTMLFFERAVHAYVDPGSGSMFLQLLLGGIAGVGVIVKLYWRRLADLFSRQGTSDPGRRSDAQ